MYPPISGRLQKPSIPIQGTIISNTGKYIFPGIAVFLSFQHRIEQRNLCGTNIIIRIIFSAANIRLTKNQLIFGKKRSVVSQRDRGDRLHHDRTAQGDAGVVPPFDDELFHPSRRKIERILFLRDAGSRFDSDAEHHGIAVRDTAVDSARPVGSGFPSPFTKQSLCSEPFIRAAANPSPNSMPRTAGIENAR